MFYLAKFWVVESHRRVGEENVTEVSNPAAILHECRRLAAELCTATVVRNPPTASRSSKAGLQEVAAPAPTAEGNYAFHGIADWPMFGDRPASRILLIQTRSSALLLGTVQHQIASIPTLVEHVVLQLFGNTGQAKKLSTDGKVLATVRAVANRLAAETFQSLAF